MIAVRGTVTVRQVLANRRFTAALFLDIDDLDGLAIGAGCHRFAGRLLLCEVDDGVAARAFHGEDAVEAEHAKDLERLIVDADERQVTAVGTHAFVE